MADEIVLPIRVNPKDALDGLGKFEKASRGASDVFIGVLGAKAVEAVVKGVGKAIGEFAGFFTDGIESAKKQETALKDLEIQLGLLGEASQGTLDEFVDFAAEIQRNTLIADDAVLRQVALAKSFGLSNDAAKDLVTAATELSAVTGETLETSVKELGKTYAGQQARSVTLRRATEGLTKAQLESGEAVRLVLDQFGGTAAAKLDTFTGQTGRVTDNWANLGETFGETLVQNPMVIATMTELADFLEYLAEVVVENQDTITEWIDAGILAAGTAMSVSIDVIRFFADALNGIVSVGAVLLTGLGEIVHFMTGVWDKTIGNAGRVVLTLLESIGILDEGAVEAFDNMVDGIRSSVDDATNAVAGFALDGEKRARQIDKTYQKVSGAVDNSVNQILAAEKKQVGSINKLAKERGKAAVVAERDAAAVAKGIEAAAKLESEIYKDTESDIQKATRVRSEFQAKIKEQLDLGNIDKQKAADLEEQIQKDLIGKLEKLRSDADAKALEDAQKQAEEMAAIAEEAAAKARERVEAAATDPIKFIIEADEITQGDFAPLAAGFATSILEGAAGAQKLISSGVGALADTFLPGIGGAVSTLIDQLARGPEENKKFVREFVEAVPEMVEAIAESIPVVVEALVDSLINEGGIVDIAMAFARALSGEAIFKSIGKQIGLEFGNAFNLNQIGTTIRNAISSGMTSLGNFIGQIPSKIAEGARLFFQKYLEVGQKIGNFLTEIGTRIGQLITAPFKALRDALSKFKFPALPTLKAPPIFKRLSDALKNLFKTPAWVQKLIDLVNRIPGVSAGGGSGSGIISSRVGGGVGKAASVLGLAKGMTSVPAGFLNDSFGPVNLESYERVVSAPQNKDLTAFLSDYQRGALQKESDNGGFDPEALDILRSIAIQLERSGGQEVVVKIDKREIARAQLGNNRLNARTA